MTTQKHGYGYKRVRSDDRVHYAPRSPAGKPINMATPVGPRRKAALMARRLSNTTK